MERLRKKFEEWAESEGFSIARDDAPVYGSWGVHSSEGYEDEGADGAWKAYQARQAEVDLIMRSVRHLLGYALAAQNAAVGSVNEVERVLARFTDEKVEEGADESA